MNYGKQIIAYAFNKYIFDSSPFSDFFLALFSSVLINKRSFQGHSLLERLKERYKVSWISPAKSTIPFDAMKKHNNCSFGLISALFFKVDWNV